MRNIERFCINLRHQPFIERADWLWNGIRPVYNRIVNLAGRSGLARTINGTDVIRVMPEFRAIKETYEPELWGQLLGEVRHGDVVADVGAYVGLYTVALARRVGTSGRVFAFEPDGDTFNWLSAHCDLNGVTDRVTLLSTAVGNRDGPVPFLSGKESQSCVGAEYASGTPTVMCRRLDQVFADIRLDILKVDVEGYEYEVLKGANNILGSVTLRPRALFIEVHPYAWPAGQSTSSSLLGLLAGFGYDVVDLDGHRINVIREYGEIVARQASYTAPH